MRFWDSSALVPLLVREPLSARCATLFSVDASMVVWWGTLLECTSALARRRADDTLDASGFGVAMALLRQVADTWNEVPPADAVREQAIRLVRVHRLRAADSLQLAAAIVASDFEPSALEFVTFDARQATAAALEGFRVVA